MSGDPLNVCEHREWTTRKIDTNLSGGHLRDRMADMANREEDDMSAKAEQQIDTMFTTFCGPQPNAEGSGSSRALTVLDNAMWTANRIKEAKDEAHAAAVLAGNCNTMLVAICEKLGIDPPEEPDPPT